MNQGAEEIRVSEVQYVQKGTERGVPEAEVQFCMLPKQ